MRPFSPAQLEIHNYHAPPSNPRPLLEEGSESRTRGCGGPGKAEQRRGVVCCEQSKDVLCEGQLAVVGDRTVLIERDTAKLLPTSRIFCSATAYEML